MKDLVRTKQTIIISAVNFTEGGPLSILRNFLAYLSSSDLGAAYRVIAIVHKKEFAFFPNIEYIEIPRSKKSWFYRLYCEYVHFYKLSKIYQPFLWLSLHDMTPRVKASKRAVYMHNPIPFFKWNFGDLKRGPVYVLFALFYKYLYRINIHQNNYLIVQQSWLRNEFGKMFKIDPSKIVVNTPAASGIDWINKYEPAQEIKKKCMFFYPSLARPFKNFEIICEAVHILNKKNNKEFDVFLTINGQESPYSKWVVDKYRHVSNIHFCGLLDKTQMEEKYLQCDCLIFPSKLETWGLPISEFTGSGRPMILADLGYAHETAQGSQCTSFFDPSDASALAKRMEEVMTKALQSFAPQEKIHQKAPFAADYKELFEILLHE